MAAEVEQRHIPVFVHEDESSHGLASSSSLPNMDQETSLHADINLGSPSSTLAEKLSSFHLKRDNECDNMSDNDSAKAGLDDSTDDELLTATSTNDPLDSDISAARERQASRLAEIYSRIEQTTRDHDAAVEALFRARIASLTLTIKTGDQERENLTQIIRQKDTEIGNLHQEIAQEKQRHAEELAQQAKLAHEERVRAGMEWEREFNEAMEKRGREHQESIEQQHQQHHQAIEQREQEHQQALESLRQEMMQESEQRVSNLIEEMQREAEQRVNKIRSEMDQMRAEFERETEQTMKDMRGEMARLVEREREAREKLRRAETMPLNNNRGAQSRDQSPNVRPGLQQSSSWAIARLWGVGQPRTRSFS